MSTIRDIAEHAAPVFKANNWTWHDGIMPDVDRIEEAIKRLISIVREEDTAWARTGRLEVSKDDEDGGLIICIRTEIGWIEADETIEVSKI